MATDTITKKSHPKSYALYEQHIRQKFQEAQRQPIPFEVLDKMFSTTGITDLSLTKLSRDLFDFLDEQGLIVSTWKTGIIGWKYRIEDAVPVEGFAPGTRKDVERVAFYEAFNKLEKR